MRVQKAKTFSVAWGKCLGVLLGFEESIGVDSLRGRGAHLQLRQERGKMPDACRRLGNGVGR